MERSEARTFWRHEGRAIVEIVEDLFLLDWAQASPSREIDREIWDISFEQEATERTETILSCLL